MSTPGTPSPLDRALAALDRMEARLNAVEQAKREPIAIVGLGCRFPGGATDPERYWAMLEAGVDAVRELPAGRWPKALTADARAMRWAGLLDAVDGFDADFFGISPREAMSLDPQQRLLLEVAWEALENAGQPPASLAGSRTGVFVGISTQDYHQRVTSRDPGALDAYAITGTGLSFATWA